MAWVLSRIVLASPAKVDIVAPMLAPSVKRSHRLAVTPGVAWRRLGR